MDPLFERRELTRNVHVDARNLKKNIQSSLLAQIRHRYEGKCVAEGYLQPRSFVIVDYSLGRTNLIRGGIDYVVRFQADICLPHPGQVFRAPVALKSKIGIHAELPPLKVLLPRDLHIGNGDFDDAGEAQEIEFEVVGARFQQGDESIVVLGKLKTLVRPAAPAPASEDIPPLEPVFAAPVGNAAPDSEKRVVTIKPSAAVAAEGPARRRRLNPSSAAKTNE